jgi:hypothetical protein
MVKVKYLELNPFSGHYGILAMSSYINWDISYNVSQNDDQLDPNPEFRSVSLWIAHIEWNEMYWRNKQFLPSSCLLPVRFCSGIRYARVQTFFVGSVCTQCLRKMMETRLVNANCVSQEYPVLKPWFSDVRIWFRSK